jgi:hypothetical protein
MKHVMHLCFCDKDIFQTFCHDEIVMIKGFINLTENHTQIVPKPRQLEN